MENSLKTVPLSTFHRVIIVISILVSTGLYFWAEVLYIHYNALRMPFIEYPSVVIPEEPSA